MRHPGDYFIFGEQCGMFSFLEENVVCAGATSWPSGSRGSTPQISDNQDSVGLGAVDAYGPQNCRERPSELDRSLEKNPVCLEKIRYLEKNTVYLEKNTVNLEKQLVWIPPGLNPAVDSRLDTFLFRSSQSSHASMACSHCTM